MLRLFVAIPPPEPIRDRLAALQGGGCPAHAGSSRRTCI